MSMRRFAWELFDDEGRFIEVTLAALLILPSGIASAEAFGTLDVKQQLVTSSISSAEAFGTLQLNQQVNPSAISSTEVFGTLQLNQQISAASIVSSEAFGTLNLELLVSSSSISSAEAFGTLALNQAVNPSAISSAEIFGTPAVTIAGAQTIVPSAIASSEAFGTAQITQLLVTPRRGHRYRWYGPERTYPRLSIPYIAEVTFTARLSYLAQVRIIYAPNALYRQTFDASSVFVSEFITRSLWRAESRFAAHMRPGSKAHMIDFLEVLKAYEDKILLDLDDDND